MSIRKLLCYKNLFQSAKCFHTSPFYFGNPAKTMKKVMGFSTKKRRCYVDYDILPNQQMLTKGNTESRNSRAGRRTLVLNKLFMRYITDILSTGEYSEEFLKYKVEISKVNVSPDFKSVNVFWVAKGTCQDDEIERFLKKHAHFLRHELSSLRVIGVVPLIFFQKDTKYSQILEVDLRLATADFGEDFIATELGAKLKAKLELFSSLPSNVKDKIQELDAKLSDESVTEEFPEDEMELIEMPQDVLGLNHSAIMNRITTKMNKIKLKSFEGDTENQSLYEQTNSNTINITSNKQQREEFQAFLKKRERLLSKMRKLESKINPDMVYIEEEKEEHQDKHLNFDSYDQDFDEDDIVEDVDDYFK